MQKTRVDQFVTQVRAKLNRNLLWSVLAANAAIAAGSVVFCGLWFVWQGYAVPRPLYLFASVVCLMGIAVAWGIRRISVTDASHFADEFFGLQDAVTTCRNFAAKAKVGGYYELQAAQAEDRVTGLSAKMIPTAVPVRMLSLALVLSAAAGLMAFKTNSPAIEEELARQHAVLEGTESMNQELAELVDKLEEELEDEEERKLVEPNKLREWVDELKQTDDQKEALRQYAKLEQKMQKAATKLQQKRDEQYLERAAKELDKGRETKQLAKTLEQKKYAAAAQELEKLKPHENKPLSEQRKQLAKLKAAAKRMAAAAKQQPQKNRQSAFPRQSLSQQLSQNSGKQNNQPAKSKPSQDSNPQLGPDGEPSNSIQQLVQELQESVEDLDQQLAKAERQAQQMGECDEKMLGQCQACSNAAQKSLGKLGRKLGRMSMKQKLAAKLANLCKACSQCQSQCAGLCQSSSPNAGGKQAGWGSSDTRRNEQEALVDNGQYTELKGIKGAGPSVTAVEAAEDGSGVSTARRVAVSRSFEHQVESFVEREDVPDDVKSGVRKYFEMIHQSE